MGVIIQILTERKRVCRRKSVMINAPEIILKKRGPGSRMTDLRASIDTVPIIFSGFTHGDVLVML